MSFQFNALPSILATCSAILILSACGKDSPTEPPEPAEPPPPVSVATRITISPSTLAFTSLAANQNLTTVVYDQNGRVLSGVTLSWSSGDASVVTVNAQGMVRSIGVGSTTITVSSGNASATVEVKVDQKAASIQVMPAMVEFGTIGRQQQLTATVFDANRNAISGAALTWSSSDLSVATVTTGGLVTSVSRGTARITAASGTVTQSVMVTVVQPVDSVEILPTPTLLVSIGETLQLQAKVLDDAGNEIRDPPVTWWSNDSGVAEVDSFGVVVAVANGTAVISAAVEAVSDSIAVTVTQEVHRIALSPAEATIVTGDSLILEAVARDPGGAIAPDAVISWSSSDESIATVDDRGLVVAAGEGKAEVTAASGDVSGRAQITVESPRPAAVRVMPPVVTMTALGEQVQLTAEVLDQRERPMDTNDLTWSSEDPGTAAVDQTGLVTAVANGVARVAAEAGTASGISTITVAQRVRFLAISPEDPVVAVRDTLRLTAMPTDAGGSFVPGITVSWSSDNETVAQVGQDGLVWGLSPGTSRITADTGERSTHTDLAVVNPDRNTLAEIFDATDGMYWENNEGWTTDEPLGAWHGVRTDAYGRVTVLDLRENGLNGVLTPAFARLDQLETLLLSDNRLRGPIPRELAGLENLKDLFLDYNRLSGSIPPELGELSKLRSLILQQNQLTGPIPPELGMLSQMYDLLLNDNQLSGPLPGELARLPRLANLTLHNNQLTGPVPSEFRHLAVGAWHFNGNRLTGPIPTWIGQLDHLRLISLGTNHLIGRVPAELGMLTELTHLYLHNNPLSGPLPLSLTSLRVLDALWLHETDLCAPNDEDFQAWLQTILDKRGVVNCAE